jgi:adenylate cyclase
VLVASKAGDVRTFAKTSLAFIPSGIAGRIAALSILLALMVLRTMDPVPVEELRLRVFDAYQRLAPRPVTLQPVIIVDIDEDSLAELGQWPWPRTQLAQLIDSISQAGAVAIALDFVLAEPDRTSPLEMARILTQLDETVRSTLATLDSNDEVLARSLARTRVVVAQSGFVQRGAPVAASEIGEEAPVGILGPDPTDFLVSFPNLLVNVPEVERAATGKGLFSIRSDPDGVIRRVPAIMTAAERLKPALVIELLRVAVGADAYLLRTGSTGIESLSFGGVTIPTDANGRVWLRYNGHDPNRFISARDVLHGRSEALQELAGKLVLIGTSAVGLLDIKTTPLDAAMPGVEVHAQLLENLLSSTLLHRPNYAVAAEVLTAALAGLAIVYMVPLIGALAVLALGVATSAGLVGGAFYAFLQHGILIDASYPLVSSIAVFWTLVFVNYFREERQRRQIRSAFGQYLSPDFVEELARDPQRLELGGQTKELTILFSDVRNFTTISELYKSNPQGLTRLMNRLLAPLSDAVIDNHGTIDKYIGDSIMAFWNAPVDDPHHALHACAAALEMQAAIDRLNDERRVESRAGDEPAVEFAIGIGINTGETVVGNMGSEARFNYTVLGDTVNLASRLEGQTKVYGVSIVLGSRTNALVEDRLATVPLDIVQVKGKSDSEPIFALLGNEGMVSNPEFASLRRALQALLEALGAGQWKQARLLLQQAEELMTGFQLGRLCELYHRRIVEAGEETPPQAKLSITGA